MSGIIKSHVTKYVIINTSNKNGYCTLKFTMYHINICIYTEKINFYCENAECIIKSEIVYISNEEISNEMLMSAFTKISTQLCIYFIWFDIGN